mmetsp:Transcript_24349/g.73079  ORF Transcript_24349/g.73079 Transcript_24349/m.73079 type:complete len:144 (-) Transcript_24349:121-552(-)|eukprot:CAMPEP_0119261456 /NCGR_PEP_ID=MMETSP1329-20130426/1516_1 /TAXON_ID=114041 /ORGANISM="Genus nov. species nov., Strain RCC1024" /LENGTH=143 /DNA_ID=CAMNT_0007261021 /DNA_START=48 /DNA_END=479 /DNA_ORIENTATION=+
MKLLLALLFSAAAALKHKPALAVRGGGAVGMVDEAFAQGLGRTAAGLTIGGAILEKYGGMDSNTITSAVSGEVFGTNAAIVFASYVTGVLAGDTFKAVDVAASLWIANLVLKLKDSGINEASIKANLVNAAVAGVMGIIAFTD